MRKFRCAGLYIPVLREAGFITGGALVGQGRDVFSSFHLHERLELAITPCMCYVCKSPCRWNRQRSSSYLATGDEQIDDVNNTVQVRRPESASVRLLIRSHLPTLANVGEKHRDGMDTTKGSEAMVSHDPDPTVEVQCIFASSLNVESMEPTTCERTCALTVLQVHRGENKAITSRTQSFSHMQCSA